MTLSRNTALVIAAALLCAAAPARPAQQFDREAWKTDFERIKAGLAQGYANLDWQIDKRGFNLVRASQQINSMLDKANSDVEAVVVFYRLVDAFHDPHLQLLPGPAPQSAALLPRQSSAEGPVRLVDSCAAARYSDRKPGTSLPYARAPEWEQISAAPFQAGMIGDVGIIRIPSFDEQHYLSVCKAVSTPNLHGRELQLATRTELNRRLMSLIGDLRARGVKKLAIDVSGNGGGSEWSSEVAAMFAAGTLRRNAPRVVAPKCDRSPLWQGKAACSVYGQEPGIEELKGTAVWTGPLAVLTDRRSASASEELVTWLKDNGRAVIAGERTYGAGCGYVDGGSAISLRAANLHIMVPNCSRYTRDGVNEIEGIAPTVALDWMTLTPDKTAAALEKLYLR
jgi:hypothetical protein